MYTIGDEEREREKSPLIIVRLSSLFCLLEETKMKD